jgi:hypothetical protein
MLRRKTAHGVEFFFHRAGIPGQGHAEINAEKLYFTIQDKNCLR